MDPLSATASIVGILASAGKIIKILHQAAFSIIDAPKSLTALVKEVGDVHAAFSALQSLLMDLSLASPRRTALIQVDRLVVMLTETMLTLSELERIVSPLALSHGGKMPLGARLKWGMVQADCQRVVEKLQMRKWSVILMLNVVQCASDAEAARSQQSLTSLVEDLLKSNQELCRRMKSVEDVFADQHTVSHKFDAPSLTTRDESDVVTMNPQHGNVNTIFEEFTVQFAFDEDLESSRVYRRVARYDYCDRSFKSSALRTNAWSILSGLSLADISVISVIALPVFEDDIGNSEHYMFGMPEPSQLLGSAEASVNRSRQHEPEEEIATPERDTLSGREPKEAFKELMSILPEVDEILENISMSKRARELEKLYCGP